MEHSAARHYFWNCFRAYTLSHTQVAIIIVDEQKEQQTKGEKKRNDYRSIDF